MDNQELVFELIGRGSFNNFDGPDVVEKLKQNKDLWKAVVCSDDRNGEMTLRDLPEEFHIDTLYIKSSGKNDKKLEKLMLSLKADEVDWQDKWRHSIKEKVLRAWWD